MKLLIIGSGFIAQSFINYVERFKNTFPRSLDICMLVHSYPKKKSLFDSINSCYIYDATDQLSIENLLFLEKVDFILVLAGCSTVPEARANPNHAYDVNLKIVSSVCDACMKYGNVKGILFSSTSMIYTAATCRDKPFREDSFLDGNMLADIYAKSKYFSEMRLRDYPSLPIINMRLANLYGPLDQSARLIPATIEKLLRNEPPVIFVDEKTGKSATLDYLFIDDLCSAMINILFKIEGGCVKFGSVLKTINIGSGNLCTTEQIIKYLLKITGIEVEPIYTKYANIDRPYLGMDTSLAREEFNFVAKTPLYEGLCLTYAGYMTR